MRYDGDHGESFLLPAGAQEIFARVERAGGECFLVGGAVRDVLLGKAPDDLDLAVSLPPDEIAALFGDCRLILTGEKHGTVGVFSGDAVYEVTTFRRDGKYKDARRPESVSFTRSLTEDLRRRDFTVNAMAWSERTGLCDPFGGEKDLREKTLRAVGDPRLRFGEDALRILRLARFASVLGFSPEEKTRLAAEELAPTLALVSGERIAEELRKLFRGKRACASLSGLPEIRRTLFGDFHLPPALPGDFAAALALIFRGRKKELEDFARLRRLSSREREEALLLEGELSRPPLAEGEGSRRDALRLLGRIGPGLAGKLVAAREAAGEEDGLGAIRAALASGIPFRVTDLAVRGDELEKETGASGAALGKLLRSLLEDVTAGILPNEKTALIESARERSTNHENDHAGHGTREFHRDPV